MPLCPINPPHRLPVLAELDGISDNPGQHVNKSFIVGDMGPYLANPSHSFLAYLGPQCYILLLDCRFAFILLADFSFPSPQSSHSLEYDDF
jgi:hypothetical protein